MRSARFADDRALFAEPRRTAHCFFEWIYFANVASTLDDRSVYLARSRLGQELASLERTRGMVDVNPADTVVVPGHGAVVDRRFVEQQCDELRAVAETIRELAGRGVPEAEAYAAATWPFPEEALHHAIPRGYAHLPRARRQLPLI